jgi:GNAT superfamily N-acetyltransferase
MTFTVRTVAAGEQVIVRALLTEAFLPYEPHFPAGVFVPYLRDLLDLVEGDPVTVVAEQRGEVVGTMRLHPPGAPHKVPLPPGWAMVRAVAVAPRLRRSGVAQALLAECERRARRTGATHLAFHAIDQIRDTFAFALRLGYPRRPDLDFDGGELFGQPPGKVLVKAFGRRLVSRASPPAQ